VSLTHLAFFFTGPAATAIYTLSLHDALPIFTDNLSARREQLGLTVPQVHQELNRRGIDVAFSTVAGWFNGSRGGRWKVEELQARSEEHTSELQSRENLVCRLLLEKKNTTER